MMENENEWVPEVGEHVEFNFERYGWIGGRVVGMDGSVAVVRHNDGYIGVHPHDIRKIKSEAEKQRDKLIEQAINDCFYGQTERTKIDCEALIDKGWRKPKRLTDDVITEIWIKNNNFHSVSRAIESYILGEGA